MMFRNDEEYNKKYYVPRHRRFGFPPITPNACVRDAVFHQVFDTAWSLVISCLNEPISGKQTSLLKVCYPPNCFIF